MPQGGIILFVCEHGAAKSILAAAYFNKIAREIGLGLQAIARGTNPDKELSPNAITGLLEDGLIPTEQTPQKLSLADLESAQQVITFCELPLEYKKIAVIKRWDGVPSVSENFEKARDAIIAYLNELIRDL
jgi:arsenate reductase (thioredoxin)